MNRAPVDEVLLRGQGQVLKARIDAMGVQLAGAHMSLDGLTKERRAIAQEVDLYERALEHVLADNAQLRHRVHELEHMVAQMRGLAP